MELGNAIDRVTAHHGQVSHADAFFGSFGDHGHAAEDRVVRMFDPTFVRMWRLYLTGSAASFLAGELQLFQVVFARPQVNEIPWTRAGVYRPSRPADR